MILKHSFYKMDEAKNLLAYQQGVLDIAAYNSALLKVAAPSILGLSGEQGKNADACYKRIINCANDWMQVVVPHCRIVPETIAMYDWSFRDSMETLKQGLATLIDNPDAVEVRKSLEEMLADMSQVICGYQKDLSELITDIETYFHGMQGNIADFNTILTAVLEQIQLDEKKKQELQEKINKTMKELWDARQRIEKDEKLLGSTWFIVISIFALGIPLVAVGIDKMFAQKTVQLKEAELSAAQSELADVEKMLLALYASKTAYEQLLSDVQKILKSSDAILGVWRKFSETCSDFAKKIKDESSIFEKADLEQALKEIAGMEEAWKKMVDLAEPLSEMEYEIVVVKEAAA